MSDQFNEFEIEANKIIAGAIDSLSEKIKDLQIPQGDVTTFQMLATAACMNLSRDLLKRYHEELMKFLRSKGL